MGNRPWKSSEERGAGREGQVLSFPIWVCFSSSISLHNQSIGVTHLDLETISHPKLIKG